MFFQKFFMFFFHFPRTDRLALDRPSAGPPKFRFFPSPVANFVLSSLFGGLFGEMCKAVGHPKCALGSFCEKKPASLLKSAILTYSVCLALVTLMPTALTKLTRDQLSRGERWQCPCFIGGTGALNKCAFHFESVASRKLQVARVPRPQEGTGGGVGNGWRQTDGWTVTKARTWSWEGGNQARQDFLNQSVRHCSEDKSQKDLSISRKRSLPFL